jgi:hypothetical protein
MGGDYHMVGPLADPPREGIAGWQSPPEVSGTQGDRQNSTSVIAQHCESVICKLSDELNTFCVDCDQ